MACSCLISMCGCKARDPLNLAGDNEFQIADLVWCQEFSDHKELPAGIRYLDGARDLKESYTFAEAQARYAIKLYRSTLICESCDDIFWAHAFCCFDYGSRLCNCVNEAFYHNKEGTLYHYVLEDTEYKTLDAFAKDFEENKYVCLSDYYSRLENTECEILENTRDHVFASAKWTYGYKYYYAEKIGGRVYLTKFGSIREGDTSVDPYEFRYISEVAFSHLYADNGKEPYIYDKMVNVTFFGDKHLTNFNQIAYINRYGSPQKNQILLDNSRISGCEVIIEPNESMLEYNGRGQWESTNDIQTRRSLSLGPYNELLVTIDGVQYLCEYEYYNQIESSEDMISFLELTDVIE